MKRSITARTVLAIMLFSVGLALSSCVVYEPAPRYHGYHDHWR